MNFTQKKDGYYASCGSYKIAIAYRKGEVWMYSAWFKGKSIGYSKDKDEIKAICVAHKKSHNKVASSA